jgi:beta-lactam-binding protein with PASTA domain
MPPASSASLVQVPDAVGLAYAHAVGQLSSLGLEPFRAGKRHSAEDKGAVAVQKIGSGTSVKPGTRIGLFIAVKPHMPKVVGLRIEQAVERLKFVTLCGFPAVPGPAPSSSAASD